MFTHLFFNSMYTLFILDSLFGSLLSTCFLKIVLVGIGFGPYSICHGCMVEDIKGFGWKCTRCVHYTLCSPCYFSGKHLLDHRFARFDTVSLRSDTVTVLSCAYCTTFAITFVAHARATGSIYLYCNFMLYMHV